jgi:hypothetical protein
MKVKYTTELYVCACLFEGVDEQWMSCSTLQLSPYATLNFNIWHIYRVYIYIYIYIYIYNAKFPILLELVVVTKWIERWQ